MQKNELFTKIEEARAFAQATVDTVREPFLVLDHDLRVLAANRSFYQASKVSSDDTQGRLLAEARYLTKGCYAFSFNRGL